MSETIFKERKVWKPYKISFRYGDKTQQRLNELFRKFGLENKKNTSVKMVSLIRCPFDMMQRNDILEEHCLYCRDFDDPSKRISPEAEAQLRAQGLI